LQSMKKISWFSVILVFLIASCQQVETISREEVLQVINRFDEGWRNKNATLVDSVLSPQYLYFTQSGGTFDRTSLVKTAASSEYTLQTMERQEFTMQIEGNSAVVNTIWKGNGAYHGEAFNDKQRCSITIVKLNGQVKILSEHCTPIK
jgi:hypothetical protein